MIGLFINSVTEYTLDLQSLQETKVLHDLKRTIHKLKPSVLSMEVTGAKEIILKLEEVGKWDDEVEELVGRLMGIFQEIRPKMENDLERLGV